ncbi:hypothetical protein ANN_26682 [Periplaneta americana]|uniref:Uncharacterized protein n=1 Tax=Periplaneta americana TaxID=6978 RepID=A0ABQ8RYQ9_PERAM|nr:hypothetical protein ANN_26682 [Periplaneta americana]
MAGLCEGGNEPPGSLIAVWRRLGDFFRWLAAGNHPVGSGIVTGLVTRKVSRQRPDQPCTSLPLLWTVAQLSRGVEAQTSPLDFLPFILGLADDRVNMIVRTVREKERLTQLIEIAMDEGSSV